MATEIYLSIDAVSPIIRLENDSDSIFDNNCDSWQHLDFLVISFPKPHLPHLSLPA